MRTYRVEHQLSEADAARPGAEHTARAGARREVLRQARAEWGPDLPQTHSFDEAMRPDGAGGFIVEAVLTVTDPD